MSLSEEIDFSPPENSLSKQVKYLGNLANNTFVCAPNMVLTLLNKQ